jgi:NAD(P)-dependent dehydrogenase (short-subunit alcohol dehydrogenase family)
MEGRVAIVTGAGRGIGRATALALARRGARVLGVSRTEAELAALAEEAPVEVLAESVATEEGCERVVAEARTRLGPVAILVLNAGIGSGHEREVWAQETAVWRETMAVNLDGPFFLCRAASADMKEGGWGRIVMVSSTSGEVGSPRCSAYTASKHGLMGLMRAVAQDIGPFGATCNAVLPGWVRTEMAERSARIDAERQGATVEEVWAERAAAYPSNRVVSPDEVAETIAFLASDAASGVNGEGVTVALGGLW